MLFAKLSTDKTIVFGPVLDSTGAAVTSEVVASIKIMKNGASAAALDAAATLTHSATGVYLLLLKAADISAVGECTVVLNSGTNSASAVRLNVLPATVYSAIVENAVNATGGLVGATAAITTMAGEIATATNITAGTITTTTNLTNAPTSGDLTATMKASVTAAVPTVASIQSGLATPTNITAGTITTTTNLTNAPTSGDLTATMKASVTSAVPTVASIQSGLATPTNITAATGITVSSIGANVVTASALAADAVAEIADGIWDEATSGHTISGTYGGRIVRATNSNVEVQITASNHVAADVHEFQAGVITAGDFAANSITASALAADAVTEIQSGLATAANLLIVSDGVGYITSVLLGTISDAGTAGETYVITFGGATYTLDYTGLDATGNRTGVTRTKV